MARRAGAGTGGTGEDFYKGPLAEALLQKGYEADSDGSPRRPSFQPLLIDKHRPASASSITPTPAAPAKTSCFKLRIKTYCALSCLSSAIVFAYFISIRQLSLDNTHTSDCFESLKLPYDDLCNVSDQAYWLAACNQTITACVKACLQEKPPSLTPFCNPHYKALTGAFIACAVISLSFGVLCSVRSISNYCERKSKSSNTVQIQYPALALRVVNAVSQPTTTPDQRPHHGIDRTHSAPAY